MTRREELEKMTEEELDEYVHDVKGDEAAEINNSGKKAQIDFLLGERREDRFQRMLDLSNRHVPSRDPDWGDLRVLGSDFGWVVFVRGGLTAEEREKLIPAWLQPIHDYADHHDCIVISFDAAGDVDHRFTTTWDW